MKTNGLISKLRRPVHFRRPANLAMTKVISEEIKTHDLIAVLLRVVAGELTCVGHKVTKQRKTLSNMTSLEVAKGSELNKIRLMLPTFTCSADAIPKAIALRSLTESSSQVRELE